MRTLTATEVSRNFSRVLDSIERGEEEVVVIRNRRPVAKLISGVAHMNAREALTDLYRTLDDAEGEFWIADMRAGDRRLRGQLRNPWA